MFEISTFEQKSVWMTHMRDEIDALRKRNHPIYRIAMSGGSVANLLPWILDDLSGENIEIYQVDERYVDEAHPDSNARILRAIISGRKNIQFIPYAIEGSIGESINTYKYILSSVTLDLIVLGAGPDGHMASIFPHDSDMDTMESVYHTRTSHFAVPDRLTLSFSEMIRADAVWMIFGGAPKSHIYEAFLDASTDYHDIPALMLRNMKQAKVWYVREGI